MWSPPSSVSEVGVYLTRIRSLICRILVGLIPLRAQILETVVPYRLAKAESVSPFRIMWYCGVPLLLLDEVEEEETEDSSFSDDSWLSAYKGSGLLEARMRPPRFER